MRHWRPWEVSEIGAANLRESERTRNGGRCPRLGGNESLRLNARVGQNGRQPDVTSEGKTALPKKPPSGSEADHDKHCRCEEKLLAARRIFRRLVDAVVAKLGEHVAVHCKQCQENPVIACEQCRIGLRSVAERDNDAKHRKQSHACHQHSGRGLKMSLFLFKCEFPVKEPPEGGKEEPKEHTRDRENRPRCFVHSAELYACPSCISRGPRREPQGLQCRHGFA